MGAKFNIKPPRSQRVDIIRRKCFIEVEDKQHNFVRDERGEE